MTLATITSKGQVTIPVDVRTKLGLETGGKVDFVMDDSVKVMVLPVTISITSLKVMLPKPDKPVSVEDMKATVKARGARY